MSPPSRSIILSLGALRADLFIEDELRVLFFDQFDLYVDVHFVADKDATRIKNPVPHDTEIPLKTILSICHLTYQEPCST